MGEYAYDNRDAFVKQPVRGEKKTMPWASADATRHNTEATGHLGHIWAAAANNALSQGLSEGAAVRIGNAAVRRAKAKKTQSNGGK